MNHMNSPANKCESCGEVDIIRGKDETYSKFMYRRTCSDQCKEDLKVSSRLKKLEKRYGAGCLDDKACLLCGEQFSIKASEPILRFIDRPTCSRVCGSKFSVITKGQGATRTLKEITNGFILSQPKKIPPLIQRALSGQGYGLLVIR